MPTPSPNVSRPPEIWSTPAASFARSTGARVGPSRTLVNSPTRSVTAAAADSAMSDSYEGNAIRSIVASVEKPRSSARRAQSTKRRPGTPRMGFGSPIPMSMLFLLLRV